jgi:hypothetical protein
MKKPLVIVASILLLLNAIGALYGGGNFIIHPDGSGMQMSLDWLKNTPFQNYLMPGILLFVANGLFSIFVLVALMLKFRQFPWFIIAQGVILLGWISIQVLMIRVINLHHIIFWSFAIALIVIGWRLIHYHYDHQTGNRERL